MVIKAKGYNVFIEEGNFRSLNAFIKKGKYSACFILCDENTLAHCLPRLVVNCPALSRAQIIEIESGEQSKSLDTAALIWQTLLENNADKNTLFINLGGGVVTDLGGFCASVYKRGVHFIHIPTSLLAMADASVGSKTGIDLFNIKNAIGSFTEPKGVFINPDFLETLTPRHYKNGLAEVYKIALAGNEALWLQITGSKKINTTGLIAASVSLKNKIVLKDPFDNGLRKSLNFGHSIGHALESLMMNHAEALLHGEAIVIGMMVESHIAIQKKLISKTELSAIVSQLRANFKTEAINVQHQRVLQYLKNDKKAAGNKMLFALVSGIGKPVWDVAVTEKQVSKALDYYNSLF